MVRTKRSRVGIVAYYGPDNTRATKLVATVMRHQHDEEPVAMERWTVEEGDIREDTAVAAELTDFLSRHRVKKVGTAPHIIGCPHEEGFDYPLGRTCPQCPFWATRDRWSDTPMREPEPELTPEQVLRELSRDTTTPPYTALDSADAHRAVLTDPLLEALARCLDHPFSAGVPEDAGEQPASAVTGEPLPDDGDGRFEEDTAAPDAGEDELMQAKYGLYLLAKWRETRAYPLVLRWLSLPDETAQDMFGDDLVREDGGRILASVCDGNLEPIQALVLNREADPWCRAAGVRALALLGAWAEVPGERIVDWFVWLASEGLERESSAVWQELAASCLDIEAVPAFEALRQACDEELVEIEYVAPYEFDLVEEAEPGERLEQTREQFPPFDDLAEEVAWWAGFTRSDDERDAAHLHDESAEDDEDNGDDWDELEELDELEADDGWDDGMQADQRGSLAPAPAGTVGLPHEKPHMQKVGRNEPCPCGSGRKYKKCCGR